MEPGTFRKRWYVWLTAALFLVLLLVPPTSRLIRGQLLLLRSPFPWLVDGLRGAGIRETIGDLEYDYAAFDQTMKEAATKYPNDWRIQIAAAPYLKNPADFELASRFPDNPAVCASLLRFHCESYAQNDSSYTWLLGARSDEEQQTPLQWRRKPPSDADIDRFIGLAEQGERIDPNNGYFDGLHAAGLFAAHRDDEAVRALHRAAGKPAWECYLSEQIRGRVRIAEREFDNHDSISRFEMGHTVFCADHIALDYAAWLARRMATAAEKRGRYEDGLRIRHDLLAVGRLIRTCDRDLNHVSLGQSVTRLVVMCPANTPPAKPHGPTEPGSSDDWDEPHSYGDPKWRAEQYYSYLARVGHPSDIQVVRRELAAAARSEDVLHKASDRGAFGQSLMPLISWWLVGLYFLSSAFWMLLIGGLASLAIGSRLRDGSIPLWPIKAVMIAGPPGIILAALSFFACGRYPWEDVPRYWSWARMGAWAAAALGAAAWFACRTGTTRSRRFVVGAAKVLLTLAVMIFAGLFVMDRARGGHTLAATGSLLSGPVLMCMGWSPPPYMEELARVCRLWIPLTFAVPLACAMVFGFVSLKSRVPLSLGLLRGFRGLAVPVACFLVAIYVCIIPVTLHHERRLNGFFEQSVVHEGRYIAGLAGVPWPDSSNWADSSRPIPQTASGTTDRPCGG